MTVRDINVLLPWLGAFAIVAVGLILAVVFLRLDAGAAAAIAGGYLFASLAVLAIQNGIAGARSASWSLPEWSIKRVAWPVVMGPALVLIGFALGHRFWK